MSVFRENMENLPSSSSEKQKLTKRKFDIESLLSDDSKPMLKHKMEVMRRPATTSMDYFMINDLKYIKCTVSEFQSSLNLWIEGENRQRAPKTPQLYISYKHFHMKNPSSAEIRVVQQSLFCRYRELRWELNSRYGFPEHSVYLSEQLSVLYMLIPLLQLHPNMYELLIDYAGCCQEKIANRYTESFIRKVPEPVQTHPTLQYFSMIIRDNIMTGILYAISVMTKEEKKHVHTAIINFFLLRRANLKTEMADCFTCDKKITFRPVAMYVFTFSKLLLDQDDIDHVLRKLSPQNIPEAQHVLRAQLEDKIKELS